MSIIPLSSIDKEVTIEDMNYLFNYQRIIQPDGELSDLFNLHYKDKSSDRWWTCNGCLSQNFKVVQTDEIVKQISQSLSSKIAKQIRFRHGTSVKCSFVLSDFALELPEDSEADKLIFSLVTGLNADISIVSKSALSFNVINGFSGNSKLVLNYGFLKNIQLDTDNNRTVSSNNIFLLDEFSHELIHDDKNLEISYSEITKVEKSVNDRIEFFKSVPITDLWLKDFTSKIPKKFTKRFVSFVEALPEQFRNLYYITFILAFLNDVMKNLTLEVNLKNYLRVFVNQFKKQIEKKHK